MISASTQTQQGVKGGLSQNKLSFDPVTWAGLPIVLGEKLLVHIWGITCILPRPNRDDFYFAGSKDHGGRGDQGHYEHDDQAPVDPFASTRFDNVGAVFRTVCTRWRHAFDIGLPWLELHQLPQDDAEVARRQSAWNPLTHPVYADQVRSPIWQHGLSAQFSSVRQVALLMTTPGDTDTLLQWVASACPLVEWVHVDDYGTIITGDGLDALTELSALSQLTLRHGGQMQAPDSPGYFENVDSCIMPVLPQLSSLTQLQMLGYRDFTPTSSGLKLLERCANLTALDFRGTWVACEQGALRTLVESLPTIQYLVLQHAGVSDSNILALSRLQSLRHLDLQECHRLTDRGVHVLHHNHFTSMTYLNISGCRVTSNGLQELHKALPGLEIVYAHEELD